jgi:hypothetical protein
MGSGGENSHPPYPEYAMRRSTLAVLLVLAGCGGADTFTAPKGVAGSYALATYKGSPLPVVAFSDAANNLQIEIVSGTFDLNGNGKYTSVTGLRTTDKGVVTTSSFSCSGTYLASGNNVVFTEPPSGQYCGGNFGAAWNGSNELAFVFPNGDAAVFRR